MNYQELLFSKFYFLFSEIFIIKMIRNGFK